MFSSDFRLFPVVLRVQVSRLIKFKCFPTYFDYLPPVVVYRLVASERFVGHAAVELHMDEGVAFAFRQHFQPLHYVDYL